jgi:hypothetical protein
LRIQSLSPEDVPSSPLRVVRRKFIFVQHRSLNFSIRRLFDRFTG